MAFIFGSVAQGRERADSDLGLWVIGTAGYSRVIEQRHPIERRLGRQVQVLYFDPTLPEASLRPSSMRAISEGTKVLVLGDDARLAALLPPDD